MQIIRFFLTAFILFIFSCRSKHVKQTNTDTVKSIQTVNSVMYMPIAVNNGSPEYYDSSWLCIYINSIGYNTKFHGETKYFKTAHELDRYIYAHRSEVDSNSFFVKGIKDYPLKSFNDLKMILKQYDIKKIRIPTF